ncbi:MAG: PhzF family phenazine biosynthesis protein [Bryobacterales bacterium]|nr:PhzF family phenazine biosynthesis protein [Acidobacteriota bacterium]MCB9383919.1 PhzF family phenazine biosynthesis protein [Bryobacterales bacterium]
MPLRLLQVDAFTPKPFGGNPAAVCFLEQAAEEDWMQNTAVEMNLSETAFLVPQDDGSYGLRWFTPATEVDLCGHATLASAHALWETGRLAPDAEARFRTKSGLLVCRRAGDAIEMDFPATPVREAPAPKGLVEALGAEPTFVGVSRFDVFCELDSEQTVRALTPDHRGLKNVGVRGVIVTAVSDGQPYDFVSRFFAPGSGIDEDPVTGSAHCALAPYWAAKLGKMDMLGFQASPRGGEVGVRFSGTRVTLVGRAVTTLKGELLV